MGNKCKNCNTVLVGDFCHNCGQKSSTRRITLKSLIRDLSHAFTSADKGIIYTILQLYRHPGDMIRLYISGRRVRFFPPFTLMLILTGLYGLIHHFAPIEHVTAELVDSIGAESDLNLGIWSSVIEWVSNSETFMTLFMLPFSALALKWVFNSASRIKYNFAEYLYIAAYISSQRLIIRMLMLAIPFIWGEDIYENVSDVMNYVYIILITWTTKELFSLKIFGAMWRSIAMGVLSTLMLIVLLLIVIVIVSIQLYVAE